MRKNSLILLTMVLTVFLAASVWGDATLQIETATLYTDDSGVLNFSMDSPDNEVAALQVDILFDKDCFTVTAVNKTTRSTTMDIFNFSQIAGGIRIAMTGIGHSIAPGTGPVASIAVNVGACAPDCYTFDITGSVCADPLGGTIATVEVDNCIDVMEAACIPQLSATSFALGNVRVGETGTGSLTVQNVGNAAGAVTITAAGCASANPASFNLAVGASRVVTVGCSPTAEGSCSGTLTIAGCGESTVTVGCNGIASHIDCGGPYDFGEVTILETGQVSIPIKNTGDAVLNITGFDVDFQLNYATTTAFVPIAPGATFTFLLFWNPDGANGPQTGTITFFSDALEGDCVADLAGESILPPEAVLSLCADPYEGTCVDSVVRKPGQTFDAQVVITQVPPPGIVPPEMEVVSVYMQLAIDTCFFLFNGDMMEIVGGTGGDISFTNEKTVLDSMGWDIKWHYLDYYPNGDTLDIWLIGGAPMFENGCILNLGFTMLDVGTNPACPFALCDNGESALSFVTAKFNEGLPFIVTHDLRVIRNRPPEWVTDNIVGEIHEGVGTYCSALDAEQDTLWYEICAWDPDMDLMVLDAVVRDAAWGTDCVNGTEGNAFGVVSPLDTFATSGCWTVWYAPDKVCAGIYTDQYIVKSTYTTGQPCYDTLYIRIFVLETEMHAWWGTNPTGGPVSTDATTDGPLVPDTTLVSACGSIEIPIYLGANQDYCPHPPIWSIDMILDYDTDLTVGHVGNEGLVTENLGALTYSVGEGVICVSMAFNDSLYEAGCLRQTPIAYVEFFFPYEAEVGTIWELSIDHVKLNEGDPTACWQYGYLEVARGNSLGGEVYLSDDYAVKIDDVSVLVNADDPCGEPDQIVYTDADGAYGIPPVNGCENPVCVCVQKEDENPAGIVTAADASLVLRSLCNQIVLTHDQQLAADVTCDGSVSAYDAAMILQFVVGIDVDALTCIGEWVFEYVGTQVDYLGGNFYCVDDLQTTLLAENFTAALRGDVTQNWGAPKTVVGNTPAVAFQGRSATIRLTGDVYSAQFDLVGVKARSVSVPEGLQYEWNVVDNVTKIAVAGTEPVSDAAITVVVESGESLELYGSVNEVPFATRTQKVPVIPSDYSLSQNYPNPFNPETTIEFGLPEDAKVKVTVFNVLGQVATELVDAEMPAGYHVVTWDASEMASGVYFYRIQADNFTATKRMVLMK